AAVQAGRLFMTGQAQNLSQAAFKTQVCQNYLPGANTSAPALYDAQGNPVSTWAYSPGAQGQVMVVQLVYPWSVVSGPLGFVLANLPNSAAEMMGVAAFRGVLLIMLRRPGICRRFVCVDPRRRCDRIRQHHAGASDHG